MLSQSLSHDDHDDHRHIVTIFLASSAQPRLAIPTGTSTDEGHFCYQWNFTFARKLIYKCIFLFKIMYKLNTCVCSNVRVVYLHISQFTFQNINQYPAEMLCMKYEQIRYCQTIFQNKNQSFSFSVLPFTANIFLVLAPSMHIFKIYQKYLTFLMVVWN